MDFGYYFFILIKTNFYYPSSNYYQSAIIQSKIEKEKGIEHFFYNKIIKLYSLRMDRRLLLLALVVVAAAAAVVVVAAPTPEGNPTFLLRGGRAGLLLLLLLLTVVEKDKDSRSLRRLLSILPLSSSHRCCHRHRNTVTLIVAANKHTVYILVVAEGQLGKDATASSLRRSVHGSH